MEMTGDSVRRKSELLRVGCFLLSFTFYCTFSEVVRMLLLNQKKLVSSIKNSSKFEFPEIFPTI